MYLGDVGENAWEEVDVVEQGKNYGWGLVEGTHDGTLIPGDGTQTPGLTPPIIELPHGTASNSIDGGFVYRGSAIPELVGKYVFADLGQGYDSMPSSMRLSIRPIRTVTWATCSNSSCLPRRRSLRTTPNCCRSGFSASARAWMGRFI